jgi:hypothetical protein
LIVRKPNGRSHKIDGDTVDGESVTSCGLELTEEFTAAENGITFTACGEAIRKSIAAVDAAK